MTFALASPSGSIVIMQLQEQGIYICTSIYTEQYAHDNFLPPLESSELPICTMLQETSVMTKLLSSFLPVMGKRSVGGVSEDAPLALLAHEFDEQAVVLAVCADFNLRVWSVQVDKYICNMEW